MSDNLAPTRAVASRSQLSQPTFLHGLLSLVARERQVFQELECLWCAHLLGALTDDGKEFIVTTRMSWPLWQPPAETLETIAAVVAEHWNAARTSYRERSFWPTASNWLQDSYHFTNGGKLIK